jgi:hypothetical protein
MTVSKTLSTRVRNEHLLGGSDLRRHRGGRWPFRWFRAHSRDQPHEGTRDPERLSFGGSQVSVPVGMNFASTFPAISKFNFFQWAQCHPDGDGIWMAHGVVLRA